MTTHKARWYQNSDTTWLLKAPSRDGGAVKARIRAINNGRYTWHVGSDHGVALSKRGAQLAARRAVAEQETQP